MKFISLLFCCLMLGCASDDAPTSQVEHSKSSKNNLITEAKAYARQKLLYPESAKFQKISIKKENTVCGEIDDKNASGDYNGFSTFYYYKAKGRVFSRIESNNMLYRSIYSIRCK